MRAGKPARARVRTGASGAAQPPEPNGAGVAPSNANHSNELTVANSPDGDMSLTTDTPGWTRRAPGQLREPDAGPRTAAAAISAGSS